MFRPPFLARVAAGAAVYALEETRRLPSTALNFPITAISQLLQTTMHVQQFVTSLALKGDTVFERFVNRPEEQPEWATFDEDEDDDYTPSFATPSFATGTAARSRFDLFSAEEYVPAEPEPAEAVRESETASPATPSAMETNGHHEDAAVAAPEIADRFDYPNMTIAQLRARLRQLSVDDLAALLAYEQDTRDRAPFVTMLTNRIATVQAQ